MFASKIRNLILKNIEPKIKAAEQKYEQGIDDINEEHKEMIQAAYDYKKTATASLEHEIVTEILS